MTNIAWDEVESVEPAERRTSEAPPPTTDIPPPNIREPPPTIALAPSNTPVPAPPAVSHAAERARAAFAAAVAPPPRDPFPEVAPFYVAKEIDPSRLAELEATASEIHLASAELGDVFLVREHTGEDRCELTFREAATLRLLVEQFPGARVVDLRRPGLARASRPQAGEPAPPAVAQGWDE